MLSLFLLWLRLRRWPLLPLLLSVECFLLAFCCSRRGVSKNMEPLSTALLLRRLVVLWPPNRCTRCIGLLLSSRLPEWFVLVPALPWSMPMGCWRTVVGGFSGLLFPVLSILAKRSPIVNGKLYCGARYCVARW